MFERREGTLTLATIVRGPNPGLRAERSQGQRGKVCQQKRQLVGSLGAGESSELLLEVGVQ